MNKAAQKLGRLAKGKPKNYSPEEIARRTALLAKASAKRWPKIRCSKCGAIKSKKGARCPNWRTH